SQTAQSQQPLPQNLAQMPEQPAAAPSAPAAVEPQTGQPLAVEKELPKADAGKVQVKAEVEAKPQVEAPQLPHQSAAVSANEQPAPAVPQVAVRPDTQAVKPEDAVRLQPQVQGNSMLQNAAGVSGEAGTLHPGSSITSTSSVFPSAGAENNSSGAVNERAAAARAKKTSQSPQASAQDTMIEKIKEILKTAEQQRQGNTLVMRVDAEEVGPVMVKVTNRERNMYVRIVPESAEVETALRQKAGELLQVLSAAGLGAKNVHVSIGAERSETEMFQFHSFLKEQGGGQRQESYDNGYERDNGFVERPEQLERAAVLESGWVA
ncbi:MAG TPA: flagellar hook-length control protein FliK, partial [Oligoflexia bacterium]|nr:flagellar hook-length control protein FliK [Oligoflexia bacterium]